MDNSLFFSSCLVLLLLCCTHVFSQNPKTYASPDSYAEFPQWYLTRDGRADLSFRASSEDGLLLYLDSSNNSGHYLAVWLQAGRLKVRLEVDDAAPLEGSLGQHLNDLSRHDVTIVHYNQEFVVYLNATDSIMLTYDVELSFQTQSYVFIGGIPSSYSPDYAEIAEIGPLAGCIENVRFADNSIDPLFLEAKLPLTENQLQAGCLDACSADTDGTLCNGGRCVTSWSSPGGYFCDCSSSADVGDYCNECKRAFFSCSDLEFQVDEATV